MWFSRASKPTLNILTRSPLLDACDNSLTPCVKGGIIQCLVVHTIWYFVFLLLQSPLTSAGMPSEYHHSSSFHSMGAQLNAHITDCLLIRFLPHLQTFLQPTKADRLKAQYAISLHRSRQKRIVVLICATRQRRRTFCCKPVGTRDCKMPSSTLLAVTGQVLPDAKLYCWNHPPAFNTLATLTANGHEGTYVSKTVTALYHRAPSPVSPSTPRAVRIPVTATSMVQEAKEKQGSIFVSQWPASIRFVVLSISH